jgi:uncharacterized Zn-binding protein involved in type VI secretion
MSDLIIVDGDMVNFLPTFGVAVVVPIPTTIAGSAAKTKVTGKPARLEGDEKDVQSAGCMYIAGGYVIPGTGTLKIDKLNSDQLTETAKIEGKKVIVHGSMFDAVFEVQSPAQTSPPASSPDGTTKCSGGKGMFVPSNAKVHAT